MSSKLRCGADEVHFSTRDEKILHMILIILHMLSKYILLGTEVHETPNSLTFFVW